MHKPAPPAPEVSVIIRTFNEERRLPALLDGLAAQTHASFETVVVDSGSFDRTVEIAGRRADRVVRVRSADFTFGHSLNEGIRAARGRLLAIVSAHTLPMGPDWLERLVAPLREPDTAMVYGQQRGAPTESKFGELMDFTRVFGERRMEMRPPRFFANNANAAISRALWEQEPFDESLPGLEDAAWAKYWMERGKRVVYEPAAGIFHIHEETWPQVRRRYYREGQAARWIGLSRRRDLPRRVAAEAAALAGDIASAARSGVLARKAGEIVRFRYEKTVGTIGGIWSGALVENPATRARMLFGASHRAAIIRGPGQGAVETVPTPAVKPGEVLVRVGYVGVCATDLEILDGTLGYYANGQASYPIVPGHELSGTIAQVGARVEHLKPGDRVVVECIQGCHACEACRRGNWIGCVERREVGVIGRDGGCQEYMVTPARFVHTLPDGLTLKAACVCEPTAVVLKGLRRLQRVTGDGPVRVGIVGAGPIGHLSARVLRLRGHDVTLFDRRPERRALLETAGVALEEAPGDLSRFDALIEATGEAEVLETILERSTPGTAVLLLGLPYSRRPFSFESIVGYDKIIVGSVGSAARDFAEATAVLGEIDVTPFVQHTVPLEDIAQAWSLTRERRHLKVLVQVDREAD